MVTWDSLPDYLLGFSVTVKVIQTCKRSTNNMKGFFAGNNMKGYTTEKSLYLEADNQAITLGIIQLKHAWHPPKQNLDMYIAHTTNCCRSNVMWRRDCKVNVYDRKKQDRNVYNNNNKTKCEIQTINASTDEKKYE